ncbi:MAG: hypothetical protein AAGJ95_17460 [Cyanobacteria bacterium J06554_11]
MSLQGLPDFQYPIQTDALSLYRPYEGRGRVLLLPDRLDIALKADGAPDFRLALIRGKNPFLPPAPYGLIDFRVAPHYATAEGLAFIRQQNAQAMVAPLSFSGGHLRLTLSDQVETSAQFELEPPQSLAWNGLGNARSLQRLSPDVTGLLKQALEKGSTFILQAQAEMELQGVSPRLPIQVQFNPATLMAAITERLGQTLVARAALMRLLEEERLALPVRLVGDVETLDNTSLAETLTDWIAARFAQSVPAPEPNRGAYIELSPTKEIPVGDYTWDLSTPFRCYRPAVFTLDPLRAARQLVESAGLSAVFDEVTVPSLSTGKTTIEVRANLPDSQMGILELGVDLYAAPNPPYRVQAIAQSVSFTASDDPSSLQLRFSPKEIPRYQVSTYVIAKTETGIARIESDKWEHQGTQLLLSPTHFPVQFVPVEASLALLKLAAITGVCRWRYGKATEDGAEPSEAEQLAGEQSFQLTSDRPEITLSLPQDATQSVLEIEAHSISSDASDRLLKLGPYPAAALRLGRYSFLEYGPHSVEIECLFPPLSVDPIQLFAVDMLAEGEAETVTTLSFTRDRPKKEWTWFAQSPFSPGYRYRVHALPGESLTPWSEPQSAFNPLIISARSARKVEP